MGAHDEISWIHMKMQKSPIFVKKSLNINMGKIKNIVNLETIAIIQGNIVVLRIALVI